MKKPKNTSVSPYLKKLQQIEALTKGSKLKRLLHHPLKYLYAIGYWRLLYPIRKKGRYAHATTFFGEKMRVILPSATEIFLWGAKTHDSEIRLAKFLLKNLKPADTMVDVGAHFGYFSLLAAHLVGEEGKVHAFEPSQSTMEILQKNTMGFDQIRLHHRAVSDTEDELVFHEFPALFSEYNSLILPEAEKSNWLKNNPLKINKVTGLRLGKFLQMEGLTPKFIKIDVEGAEPQVLRGMEDYLNQNSTTLIMEYLLDKNQNQAHRWAVVFAEQFGYQAYFMKKNGDLGRCYDIEKYMAKAGLDSENIVLKKAQAK